MYHTFQFQSGLACQTFHMQSRSGAYFDYELFFDLFTRKGNYNNQDHLPVHTMESAIIILLIILVLVYISEGDPRSQVIEMRCSQQVGYNRTRFIPNIVRTMENIGAQIRASQRGTAVTGTGPDSNYGLAECYGDLSAEDCIICYSEARTNLPTCFPNNGGQIFLDGCFMRMGNYFFFEEYAGPNDTMICGNTSRYGVSLDQARQAISEAARDAPSNRGYFARKGVLSGATNESTYVLADCWGTLNESSCTECLKSASASILQCLPWSEGRALHTGCFMRYSNSNFLNGEPTGGDNGVNKSQSGSDDVNMHKSSEGNIFWLPNVSDEIRPTEWAVYPSYEDIKAMYYFYAVEAGFDVRKTSRKTFNGNITLQYFVCNREGVPNTSDIDTMDSKHSKIPRRTDMHRRGCQAGVKCRIIPGTDDFVFYEVEERHNHPLYSKENSHLSKTARKLDSLQKQFILRMASQNIGPTIAHRLFAALHGGYNYTGGTKDDFKNYMRDLNCYIGGSDSQLLVDKMNERKTHVENFSFDYKVDGNILNCLFWADDTSKIHYKEFGDVVSFDATFRTNRYDMVFVPFTGIDNHKKCVTFGAGLLSREDTESYVWLLEAFLKAFHKQPLLVLSDQDAAMKKAIAKVFPESKHRLCMWHITSKLQVKVCLELYKNSEFKTRFNALVWNSKIDVCEFEEGWNSFIDDYKLHDNKWFKDMYLIRDQWIPAFFKDIPMSGLMRTTSRSESENSSFQLSTNGGTTLVNFMNAFEGSMEKQRHNQSVLDFKDNEKSRKIRNILDIEVNAANHYTRQVFLEVQNEIRNSIMSCFQTSKVVDEVNDVCVISEVKSYPNFSNNDSDNGEIDKSIFFDRNLRDKEFEVCFNRVEETFTCTCMNFEHVGVLCRHIFCVMRYYKITDIPSKYVLRRWRKDLIPIEILRRTFRYGDMDKDVDMMVLDVFSSVDRCVSSMKGDKAKLTEYVKRVKELQSIYLNSVNVVESSSKAAEFEQFIGVPIPSVIEIENPTGIRNKGCATRKRLRSGKEVAIEKAVKEPRRCALCGKLAYHDKRNCPLKKKDETAWRSKNDLRVDP